MVSSSVAIVHQSEDQQCMLPASHCLLFRRKLLLSYFFSQRVLLRHLIVIHAAAAILLHTMTKSDDIVERAVSLPDALPVFGLQFRDLRE